MAKRLVEQDADALFHLRLGEWLRDAVEHCITQNKGHAEIGDSAGVLLYAWNELQDVLQSPIEALMAAELLFASDGYRQFHYDDAPGYRGTPEWLTLIEPQAKCGRYTADFLITAHCYGHIAKVVVECDGHDFHERTKEQAKSDKSRDRAMAKDGITVLRFTGSEIWADPEKCRMEIESLVHDRVSTMLVAAGKIGGRK